MTKLRPEVQAIFDHQFPDGTSQSEIDWWRMEEYRKLTLAQMLEIRDIEGVKVMTSDGLLHDFPPLPSIPREFLDPVPRSDFGL